MCIRDSISADFIAGHADLLLLANNVPAFFLCKIVAGVLLHENAFPVSYTHLDVYKRQEIELTDGSTRRCKVLEVNGDTAVVQLFEASADVYKRQPSGRADGDLRQR